MHKKRPKHLDLTKIRLPVPGIVSILHRVSGAYLFLMLPMLLYLLEGTLRSEGDFARTAAVVDHWFVKLLLLGVLWGFLHHFCAGLRYLALDVHSGVDLQTARMTSQLVLVVSVLLTAALGVALW